MKISYNLNCLCKIYVRKMSISASLAPMPTTQNIWEKLGNFKDGRNFHANMQTIFEIRQVIFLFKDGGFFVCKNVKKGKIVSRFLPSIIELNCDCKSLCYQRCIGFLIAFYRIYHRKIDPNQACFSPWTSAIIWIC